MLQLTNKVQRFSLRKCRFGLASVLLGTVFLFGMPSVSADELVVEPVQEHLVRIDEAEASVLLSEETASSPEMMLEPVLDTQPLHEVVIDEPSIIEEVPTKIAGLGQEEEVSESTTVTAPSLAAKAHEVTIEEERPALPLPSDVIKDTSLAEVVLEQPETVADTKGQDKVVEKISEKATAEPSTLAKTSEQAVPVETPINPELEKGPTSGRTAFRSVGRNPRNLAPSGTYYFQSKSGIKAEPKISSPDLAYYSAGQSVNYDSLLTAEGHQWISYIAHSGNRRYIAVKAVSAAADLAKPPVSNSTPTTEVATSSPAVSDLPSSGVYTFGQRVSVKSEPKISSPELAFYNAGDKVTYDSTLVADGHNWISYQNFRGGRSYIAVSQSSTASAKPNSVSAPTPKPAPTTSSQPVTSLPSSGVYTFGQRVSVKSEPKISSPELAFYNAGDKVTYDSTLVADGHNWISYQNFRGGRSYIAVSSASGASTPVTRPVQPAPAPEAQPVHTNLTSPNARPLYQGNTYPYGQCTWGAKQAANWVNNYWGNAADWIASAQRDGFNVGTVPVVGAVAVWPYMIPKEGGGYYGHVGVVTAVESNSSISMIESNVNGNLALKDYRGFFNPNSTYGLSGPVTYIYPPAR